MPSLTEDGGNTIGEDRSTLRDVLLCYPAQRYSIISVFNEVMRDVFECVCKSNQVVVQFVRRIALN